MVEVKPYLIRALYQWIIDNHFTPYLLVDCTDSEVKVPTDLVKNNEIVLDINQNAIRDLKLENEYISFSATFDSTKLQVFSPINSIKAIFAQENNQGMWFEVQADSKITTPTKEHKLKLV